MDALDRFNVWRKTKEAGVFANRLVIGWFAGLCFVCVLELLATIAGRHG